jgi:hypothetical protein
MNSIQPQNLAYARKHKRSAERLMAELPIEINGACGTTKNISATGVYFETTTPQEPGSKVNFAVEVTINDKKIKMVCSGSVIRIDRNNGKVGIAVQLVHSFFTDTVDTQDYSEDTSELITASY